MYRIGEKIDIYVNRGEVNFDRACDEAMTTALSRFKADDSGYLRNVVGCDRSRDMVIVVFVGVKIEINITGKYVMYEFHASVERNGEEE